MVGRPRQRPGQLVWVNYFGPGTLLAEQSSDITTVPDLNTLPRHSESDRKAANQQPCACCQDAKVKCAMDAPFSAHNCERCERRRIVCRPHENKKKPKEVKRDGAPSVLESESDSDRGEYRKIRDVTLSQLEERGEGVRFIDHNQGTSHLPFTPTPPPMENVSVGTAPIATYYDMPPNLAMPHLVHTQYQAPTSHHNGFILAPVGRYGDQAYANRFASQVANAEDILGSFPSTEQWDQHLGSVYPSSTQFHGQSYNYRPF